MAKKLDFKKLQPTGKCPHCGINCWAETNNEPAIWPCGVGGCPYPHKPQAPFALSSTGSSLALIVYDGS
jgi:hypothetical protein